jgi:hypothetical protein
MNERLRELVRQAGLDDADFPIENWDNIPLSKFAELIVRECIQVCIADIADPRDTIEQKCAKKIKEHFGVEE